MRDGMRQSITVGLVGLMVAACQSGSVISTQPNGLRTFSWSPDGLCTLGKAIPPLAGTLRGQQGAREPVWIEGPAGEHWSVVWPAGFSVTFSPAVELRDQNLAVIARDGDAIELDSVGLYEAAGTYADPYIADGLFGGGCHPFVRA